MKRIKPGPARELWARAQRATGAVAKDVVVVQVDPDDDGAKTPIVAVNQTRRTSMEAIEAVRASFAPSSVPTPSPRVKALYRAPFTETCGYVYDADGHTVADFRRSLDGRGALRPRGWGRLQYMPDGEALHDEAEAFLIGLVAGHPTDPERCLAAINAAWIAQ